MKDALSKILTVALNTKAATATGGLSILASALVGMLDDNRIDPNLKFGCVTVLVAFGMWFGYITSKSTPGGEHIAKGTVIIPPEAVKESRENADADANTKS